MSTINTSNMDQTFDPQAAAEQREKRKKSSKAHWQSVTVKKRHFVCLASVRSLQVYYLLLCYLAVSWQKAYLHFGKVA